jgi:hypothetical protein
MILITKSDIGLNYGSKRKILKGVYLQSFVSRINTTLFHAFVYASGFILHRIQLKV